MKQTPFTRTISIAVLGAGNMAQAIIRGVANRKTSALGELHFHVYTPTGIRAQQLVEYLEQMQAPGIKATWVSELSKLPACDYYLLGCKPQQVQNLAEALHQVNHQVLPTSTLLSLLAGTSTAALSQLFATHSIVRIMPNTPCLVGAGLCTLFFTNQVAQAQSNWVQAFFTAVGEVMVFEREELIDQTTAVSGSGPAYIFELARILETYLEQQGLNSHQAQSMVKATLFGASKLLKTSELSFKQLREQVTSKGGVTYEALQVLDQQGLEPMFFSALDAALVRARQLAGSKKE